MAIMHLSMSTPSPPPVREISGDLTNLYAYVYKKDQIPTLPRTGGGTGLTLIGALVVVINIHYEYIYYVATVAILHFDGQIFIALYENLLC